MLPEYFDALCEGATLVTANARLARDLRRAYDVRCRETGKISWTAADILDWNAWIRRTWDGAVQCGAAPPVILLNPSQEQLIWEQIIERLAEERGLLHIPATAAAASKSFGLASAWRFPLSESDCLGFEDSAAFVGWAGAFEDTLVSRGWISTSHLPANLTGLAQEGGISLPQVLLYAGFDELTPAQQRLFEALAGAGCQVKRVVAATSQNPRRWRVALPDAAVELEAAARWARNKLAESPGARIGVVVPDLQNRVAAVERIFEDALHPSHEAMPGEGRRVFHISSGEPLADVPVVAAALQVLELGLTTISIAQAGLLMRSPFLAGSEAERGRRALLDTELRKRGWAEVSAGDLARFASDQDVNGAPRPYACALLARSLRAWRRAAKRLATRQQPADWSRAFSRLLRLSGWPGDRSLDSAEYQAVQGWNDLLSEFAALELVAEPLSYPEALGMLQRLSIQKRFGPADEHAPVQILGTLEAAGSTFDALWVTGLDDRTWPAPPQPDPFLAPTLQRRLGLPHSSPARELAFARMTLGRLLQSAAEAIVSYPQREDDTDLRPSPLILGLEEMPAPTPAGSMASLLQANGEALESVEDRDGPAVDQGPVSRGGVAILERQAACPFGAFAQFRLNATPLEEPAPGFSPQERGMIVHAALERFWAQVRTRDALVAYAPEQRMDTIREAVASAIEAKVRGRGIASASRLIELEQRRLERLLDAWLVIEASRGPFTVKKREEPGRVEAGGLTADVRVDRVDLLPDGREVVIDYKTSATSPSDWEGERPGAPQLPLYAANHEASVAAVLFAQLVPGKLRFNGLGENAGIPSCTEYSRSRPGKAAGDTLADHIASWGRTLDALGAEFCGGAAAASPKRSDTCRWCGLPAVCRIADLGISIEDASETEDDGEPAAAGGEA